MLLKYKHFICKVLNNSLVVHVVVNNATHANGMFMFHHIFSFCTCNSPDLVSHRRSANILPQQPNQGEVSWAPARDAMRECQNHARNLQMQNSTVLSLPGHSRWGGQCHTKQGVRGKWRKWNGTPQPAPSWEPLPEQAQSCTPYVYIRGRKQMGYQGWLLGSPAMGLLPSEWC